jgi:hypothetical protein
MKQNEEDKKKHVKPSVKMLRGGTCICRKINKNKNWTRLSRKFWRPASFNFSKFFLLDERIASIKVKISTHVMIVEV